MKNTRILVVDDDVAILRYVSSCLRLKGYEPIIAREGQECLALVERENPLLVILDIMMPKMDGFETCRRLREWSQVPIIMLSARGDQLDKARCLDLGADDYLTKPFGEEELIARIRAVLRRTQSDVLAATRPPFFDGYLKFSFAERRVTVADKEVKLTPTEYNLLQELVLNAGKVLTHSYLLQKVWGSEYGGEHEYLPIFVGHLRKKIELDPKNPEYIITVSGVGYRFKSSDNLKS